METKEWKNLDRSKWGKSDKWNNEPDSVQWPDSATGLPCLAHRNSFGAWCGYVGVNEGHPLFGIGYSTCPHGDACPDRKPDEDYNWCDHQPESTLRVHGGITYSDFCSGDPGTGICHVPSPGEPDHVWWFGFDCAHSGDRAPGLKMPGEGVYRTLEYVKHNCTKLAEQLAKITPARV